MAVSPAELYDLIVRVVEDKVRDIRVTREEFDKLVKTVDKLAARVDQLAEAQRKTEERLNELAERIEQLAEAQARTEERLEKLTARVDALAEAQRRTEERLNQLAEAQARTEERLNQLAEAQRRTEERLEQLAARVDKLAEAQRRTEEVVGELAGAQARTEEAVRQLSRAVGSLSDTIGFGLEDIARVVLPGWLERHLGVKIEKLERKFLEIEGGEIEVNLYGEGEKEGKKIIVVGECKSRIHESDVDKFHEKIYGPIASTARRRGVEAIGVLFGYLIRPEAQRKAEKLGLHTIASYQR